MRWAVLLLAAAPAAAQTDEVYLTCHFPGNDPEVIEIGVVGREGMAADNAGKDLYDMDARIDDATGDVSLLTFLDRSRLMYLTRFGTGEALMTIHDGTSGAAAITRAGRCEEAK